MVLNKGLFTNGCKKVLKYVQTVTLKILRTEVQEEELKDTFVKLVELLLVQNRGLSKSLKLNLVDYYLVSYKKK